MARYAAGRDHGARVVERAGYDLGATGAVTVGSPTAATDRLMPSDRELAVEGLGPREARPEALVPRFASVLAEGRDALFVVPDQGAIEGALSVLSAPYCVAAETDVGCRTFYDGPDRIPLANGRYALAEADEYVWREQDPEHPEREGRTGSDRKEVVLTGDGEVLATFGEVDALSCPPADAFPLSYGRGDDKAFHVYDRSGSELGRFGTVRAMREHGYEPVPMPLVPEHVFERGSLARSWAVVAEDSFAVHTRTGVRVV
ncbi:hypothetical protein [Haloarchaeobius sp. HRN-SO-5]|uniref:hypothetical protein n=1 Tax=Haloarchaeobius sp. HRN-SO-5 TaxID=3446118 RepID=UPI003EBEE828